MEHPRARDREGGGEGRVAGPACRYRAPARFDDEVIVKAWIEKAHSRMVTFGYEMRLAETDVILATGHTSHIYVDRDMRRTRLPRKYYSMFGIA